MSWLPLSPRVVATSLSALVIPFIFAGCSNDGPVASSSNSTPFANVVFVGDSLTAGYQNGSLLDSQQVNGYANLVATQAKFGITLPLIAPPGAPAVLQLISAGFPPVVMAKSGTTTGRDNPFSQPTDLAVPGHTLHDIVATGPSLTPTTGQQQLTFLVLGLPLGNTNAQMAQAVALKPTTVFVWAGNNDALVADFAGSPSAMTPLSSFTTDFTTLMTTLHTQTSANIVVGNIPDVTAVPYLTPATFLLAEIQSLYAIPSATAGAILGLQAGDFVNAQGLTDTQAALTLLKSGGSPKPLPDGDVLSKAEVVTVQAMVNSYNQVIQQQAAAVGATVVDLHTYFASLAAGITINGYTATPTFLGGLFGLDGIHPTNTGYALLANQFITALNAKFTLTIPAVNVQTVAAADPYFGSNIKPVGMIKVGTMRIPTAAALRADELMGGGKR